MLSALPRPAPPLTASIVGTRPLPPRGGGGVTRSAAAAVAALGAAVAAGASRAQAGRRGFVGAIGSRVCAAGPRGSGRYARRRLTALGAAATAAETRNVALVFVKPHACTPAVLELLPRRLAERGVEVLRSGSVPAATIDGEGIIDRHYAAIARVGMLRNVADLGLSQDERDVFAAAHAGLAFDDAVARGEVYSAITAVQALGVSPAELLERCLAAGYTKLRSGLYCAKLQDIAGQPMYVMNGFYARMREKFVAPGVVVHWFVVRFDEEGLPWRDFRSRVVGATNPVDAAEGSLRAEVLARWQELGLAAEPNFQDNGVHASAGPLEALRERMIWLGDDPASDAFGAALLARGVSRETLSALLENPEVLAAAKEEDGVSGERQRAPVFDMLEDIDTAAALDILAKCTVAS